MGHASARLRRRTRLATAGARRLPGFLVIGAQRAGSTSLFAQLCAHPGVTAPSHKEIHYFDNQSFRSLRWYRSHFPPLAASRGRITGEASPYYLFHPAVPARVAAALPDVRLVALLRDPVARAHSHYQLSVRDGHEPLGFEEALRAEPDRLAGEEARLLTDRAYRSHPHRHQSYASRGLYAEQLRRWHEHVAPERLLVLTSEELFADPGRTAASVLEFLGLNAGEVPPLPVRNQRPYPPMSDSARALLEARFDGPNRELYELLGRDLGWSRPRPVAAT
ncbi:MAG TPA: sulfotransferase domain-containing protein [Gaiellales bacterium]|nr:sulfotransferase domain-containing protein [Gaiellales bacterium]